MKLFLVVPTQLLAVVLRCWQGCANETSGLENRDCFDRAPLGDRDLGMASTTSSPKIVRDCPKSLVPQKIGGLLKMVRKFSSMTKVPESHQRLQVPRHR